MLTQTAYVQGFGRSQVLGLAYHDATRQRSPSDRYDPKTPDHQEYQECQGIIYSKEEQQSAVAWNFGTVYKRILSTVFLNDVLQKLLRLRFCIVCREYSSVQDSLCSYGFPPLKHLTAPTDLDFGSRQL
jgi:hypothetical protein